MNDWPVQKPIEKFTTNLNEWLVNAKRYVINQNKNTWAVSQNYRCGLKLQITPNSQLLKLLKQNFWYFYDCISIL